MRMSALRGRPAYLKAVAEGVGFLAMRLFTGNAWRTSRPRFGIPPTELYLTTNIVAVWQLTRSATGWICGRVARLGSPM